MAAGSASLTLAEEEAAIEARLARSAAYLASNELEGRGLGTDGIERAAEYIAQQFVLAGLKTDAIVGGPFQEFSVEGVQGLGSHNSLALAGPRGKPLVLRLDEHYTPLSLSSSGSFDLPVVFAGYGISAEKEGYDDYAAVDVRGKAVIVLRHEPRQDDPKSRFNGVADSSYAPLAAKIANAKAHGAAAIIFCTDEHAVRKNIADARAAWKTALDRVGEAYMRYKAASARGDSDLDGYRREIDALVADVDAASRRIDIEADPMLAFDLLVPGKSSDRIAVLYCRREPMNRILRAALNTDLGSLEKAIDRELAPHSRELPAWRVKGSIAIEQLALTTRNVVAVLPAKGPLAEETVLIGAHYDHLGWGGTGSLAPQRKAIHYGADDNASGVAVLLELARRFGAGPPPARRLVFVAFSGEERGVLGSRHYVSEPPFPLEGTVAMVNLDMVGRLRDERLILGGTGTADSFVSLVDEINRQYGFNLSKQPSGYGPSDHMVFYARGIPVLHFYTGTHGDYHRPADVPEKLNLGGMRRITGFAEDVVAAIAAAELRPAYRSTEAPKGFDIKKLGL